jgi:hypothetical protein
MLKKLLSTSIFILLGMTNVEAGHHKHHVKHQLNKAGQHVKKAAEEGGKAVKKTAKKVKNKVKDTFQKHSH